LVYDNSTNSGWADSNSTFSQWDLGTYTNTTRELASTTTIELVYGKETSASETVTNLSQGLVGLWHFNDNNLSDASGNNNDGTAQSGLNCLGDEGKFNTACEYNGSTGYVDAGNDSTLAITQNVTLSVWMYAPKDGTNRCIICKGGVGGNFPFGPYGLWIHVAGTIYFEIANSTNRSQTFISNPSWNANTWYHIVGVANGTNTSIYLNGNLIDTNPRIISTLSSVSNNLWIGSGLGSVDEFNGTIDEVAIWNRSLSANEIKELFARGNATRGTYTSKIFNATINASWKNITWDEPVPYGEELPPNQTIEGLPGGANMTKNVLLFHFNNDSAYGENDSKVYDFSGMGNNGTCPTNVCPDYNSSGGKFSGTYQYNGSQYFYDKDCFSSPPGLLNDHVQHTILVWVKSFNKSGRQVIFIEGGQAQGYALYLNNGSNQLTHGIRHITAGFDHINYSLDNINVNTWYHIGGVYNGISGEISLFINGIKVANKTPSFTNISDPGNGWRIGGSGISGVCEEDIIDATPGHYLNGTIDEVAIWNRSLSAAEILNIYKRGALRLNLSARSCNDGACDTETFTSLGSNASYTSLSSLQDNQYFQYRLSYETDNYNYTPQLNISSGIIGYGPTSGPTSISACQDLVYEDTIYELTQDVSSNGTCFYIKAHNITLDCQGNNINYSQTTTGYGVNNTAGYDNITIRNCDFRVPFANQYSDAIRLKNSLNPVIINNSFTQSTTNSYDIKLENGCHNANISDNYMYQFRNYGSIYLNESDNAIIQKNNITLEVPGWATPNYQHVTAITLEDSKNASLYNNNITSTHWQSVNVRGSETAHFNHTIGEDNEINNLSIKYITPYSGAGSSTAA